MSCDDHSEQVKADSLTGIAASLSRMAERAARYEKLRKLRALTNTEVSDGVQLSIRPRPETQATPEVRAALDSTDGAWHWLRELRP